MVGYETGKSVDGSWCSKCEGYDPEATLTKLSFCFLPT